MKLLTKTTIATLFAAVSFNASASVTLDVSNGILMGANNVDVNGVLYNVEFTTDAVIGKMPLNNGFDAYAASQALLDQVLLGKYNDSPSLTNGCDFDFCTIITLASVDPVIGVLEYAVTNYGGIYSASPDSLFMAHYNDPLLQYTGAKTTGGTYVNALWSVAAVPEPSSFALLMTGGLTAFGFSRRKKS